MRSKRLRVTAEEAPCSEVRRSEVRCSEVCCSDSFALMGPERLIAVAGDCGSKRCISGERRGKRRLRHSGLRFADARSSITYVCSRDNDDDGTSPDQARTADHGSALEARPLL